jgi:hypothetical protein
MSTPYLYLVSPEGATYNFPPSFWIKGNGWGLTSNLKNIAFAHGGKDTADGYLESRTILVEGALRADSVAALETAERAFCQAVLAGGKLYRSDDSVNRYITVKGAKADTQYIGDYLLEKPAAVSFICEYPFWVDASETSQTEVVADGDDFTVDFSGADTVGWARVEIYADQGADLPSISLRNMNDGGARFILNDPLFVQGDIVEIDGYEGTVKRNGNTDMEYVIECKFPRLQAMTNTLLYEGGAATLIIYFRKVYL